MRWPSRDRGHVPGVDDRRARAGPQDGHVVLPRPSPPIARLATRSTTPVTTAATSDRLAGPADPPPRGPAARPEQRRVELRHREQRTRAEPSCDRPPAGSRACGHVTAAARGPEGELGRGVVEVAEEDGDGERGAGGGGTAMASAALGVRPCRAPQASPIRHATALLQPSVGAEADNTSTTPSAPRPAVLLPGRLWRGRVEESTRRRARSAEIAASRRPPRRSPVPPRAAARARSGSLGGTPARIEPT